MLFPIMLPKPNNMAHLWLRQHARAELELEFGKSSRTLPARNDLVNLREEGRVDQRDLVYGKRLLAGGANRSNSGWVIVSGWHGG
jgi:hypothetical protein